MPDHDLDDDAPSSRARQLIDDGEFDDRTEWSDAAPSADDGNAEIDARGRDGYAAWHLAVDPDAGEETKKRHHFPYGDRLPAGPRRELASGGGEGVLLEIERAFDELLQRLDAKR